MHIIGGAIWIAARDIIFVCWRQNHGLAQNFTALIRKVHGYSRCNELTIPTNEQQGFFATSLSFAYPSLTSNASPAPKHHNIASKDLTAMPENSGIEQETLSETVKDVEGSGRGPFSKKRKDVWLPFRTSSDAEERSRTTRNVLAAAASTSSQTLSGQSQVEEDEGEDDADKVISSKHAAQQQLLTERLAQSKSSTTLIATRRGPQSSER